MHYQAFFSDVPDMPASGLDLALHLAQDICKKMATILAN